VKAVKVDDDALDARRTPGAPPVAIVDVFQQGEGGCNSFRGPAVLWHRGRLLAFATCGRFGCGDWGPIQPPTPGAPHGRNGSVAGEKDVMMKVSTTRGRTWGPLTMVTNASSIGGAGCGTGCAALGPTVVADEVTGEIFLFFSFIPKSLNYHSGVLIPWSHSVYMVSSNDGFETWSSPRNISKESSMTWPTKSDR